MEMNTSSSDSQFNRNCMRILPFTPDFAGLVKLVNRKANDFRMDAIPTQNMETRC